MDLTYIKQTGESDGDAGDQYTGLDRFGRVVDQRWTTSERHGHGPLQYGYDRDRNRLYAENLVDTDVERAVRLRRPEPAHQRSTAAR